MSRLYRRAAAAMGAALYHASRAPLYMLLAFAVAFSFPVVFLVDLLEATYDALGFLIDSLLEDLLGP